MANIDSKYTVSGISLNDNALITDGNFDPSGVGYEAPVGSLFVRTDTGALYQKTGVADVDWTVFGTTSAVKQHLYRHNGAVTQTFTTTPVTVLFGTNIRNDGIYSYNAGVVTVTQAGWYDIAYSVSANNNNNNETVTQAQFLRNGTALEGTLAYMVQRNTTNGRTTCTVQAKVNLSANDTIAVSLVRISGTGAPVTIANACRLLINQIDGP